MNQEKEYCTFREIEIGEMFRAKDREWVKFDDKNGSDKNGTIHYLYGGCTVEKINQQKPNEMNQEEIDKKAKELVSMFIPYIDCVGDGLRTECLRQCALKLAGEILKIQPLRVTMMEATIDGYSESDSVEYWLKVKESINKL